MKKTFITTLCLFFIALASYAQENNERYEYCTFRVAQGFSTGASTTDFIISKEFVTDGLKTASVEAFFSKDIIFDVQFIHSDEGAIMRVFHLDEISADDLKVIFSEVSGNLDYVIKPSRAYKLKHK